MSDPKAIHVRGGWALVIVGVPPHMSKGKSVRKGYGGNNTVYLPPSTGKEGGKGDKKDKIWTKNLFIFDSLNTQRLFSEG